MKLYLRRLALFAALLPVAPSAPADVKPKARQIPKTKASNTKDVKPISTPTPRPTAPPGHEEAKFVTPPASYGSSPRRIRQTTALPFLPRGVVYLPKGSTNVAAGKPVSSSDEKPFTGTLSMVTDGFKGPYEGMVGLGHTPQWLQIDLLGFYEIHGILLWHYHGDTRVYRDVVIQLADDPDRSGERLDGRPQDGGRKPRGPRRRAIDRHLPGRHAH